MVVVFDVGGTRTRVGVARDRQGLDQIVDYETPFEWEEGMSKLIKTGLDLSSGEKITAAAGGIAGVWNKEKSQLLRSPNLPGWLDKPIKKRLTGAYGVEVKLENDAALGGLGEAVYGSGKGEPIVAYLALGTGVGGSRIVNGMIDANTYGFEPGHQMVNGVTLESLVGGRSLFKKYNLQPSEIVDPLAWEEIIRSLADGVVNLILLWSPGIVVLGGSVTKKINLDKLKELVAAKINIYPWLPKIETAKLGDEAGLWGALRYVS